MVPSWHRTTSGDQREPPERIETLLVDPRAPARPRRLPTLRRRGLPDRIRSRRPRRAGRRAYLYGQAPGIVEGAEGAPWRGRAGQTLRRWLELDEEAFYADVLLRLRDPVLPGRVGGRGDRTPTPAEQRLCSSWRSGGAAAAPPHARDHGGRPRGPCHRRRSDARPTASARATSSTTRSRSRCPTRPARAAGSTTRSTGAASARRSRTHGARSRGSELKVRDPVRRPAERVRRCDRWRGRPGGRTTDADSIPRSSSASTARCRPRPSARPGSPRPRRSRACASACPSAATASCAACSTAPTTTRS